MTRSDSTKATILLVALLASAATGLWSQGSPLTVVSATPQGEVGVMADATEIRIAFSEPMVPLGAPPIDPPAWLSITPNLTVHAYWSGTRTLIVTPAAETPLPFGTRYRVRVDESVRSVTNRELAQPFEFEFTTPTVRLMAVDWYRDENRVDRPVFLRLRFNQPVDPAVVLAHTAVAYTPHDWTPPSLPSEERSRWQREDAANLARFDAKVAAAKQAATLQTPVPVGLADTWDEERFPPVRDGVTDGTDVIVRTLTPPRAGTSLSVQVDDQLVGREGTVPHAAQSSSVQLEPLLFVADVRCRVACDPTFDYSINLTRGLTAEEFRARLSIADVTDPSAPRAIVPGDPTLGSTGPQGWTYLEPQRLGYPRQPPASTWTLALDNTTQSVDGQTLGYRWSTSVSLANERPLAQWLGDVWEAGDGTAVPFVTSNVASASQYLAPMSPADIMPTLLALQQRNPVRRPPVRGTALTFATTPNAPLAASISLSAALRDRPTGLIWASIDGLTPLPGSTTDRLSLAAPRNVLLQVTNLGLTVKNSPQSTLILVTTLDAAQAVSGARVTIRDRTNTPVWTGTTNAEGIALSPPLRLRNITTTRPFDLDYVVTAEKDDDIAWVASHWTGDVYPSRFGLRYELSEALPVLRGSVFTDRGAYLPGDQVAMKAILRFDTPTAMELFDAETRFEVTVRNPRGVEVSRQELAVNRWSSLEFDWPIPQDAPLGTYVLSVGYPRPAGTEPDARRPTVSTTFLVAAFRRPDFRVDTTLDIATPILGEDLDGDIKANFLFGAPIGAQPVRWSLWREVTRHTPPAIVERYPTDQFVFGYLKTPAPNTPRRVRLSEETTALSDDSTLHVTIPTERGDDSAATFQLEGDVTGVSGQHIANRTSLVVHPASLYVGIARPPFLVDVTTGVRTDVVAADLDGAARAGVDVTVALIRETWQYTPQPDAPWRGDWVRTETPMGEWTVTTTTGRVPLTIPLRDGGRYILRATATDSENRPTRTEAVFYAFGGGRTSWKSEGNRIELTPERQTWSPGETARILVQSPWESATALVTTEREGIRSHRRVEITSTQDTIAVPISDADIPNVYVSVLLLKGRTATEPDLAPDAVDADPGRPAFRLGYTELMVDDASKRLSVSVRADRDEYRPGAQVNVAVEVVDAARQPRAGEVTLWAMDYGLLSLTDYTVPDVARAIYAHKSLQVQTQDSRSRLISRVATGGQQSGRGAGGGRGGRALGLGSMSEEVLVAAPAPPPPPRGRDAWAITEMTPGVGGGQTTDQDIAPRTDFRPLAFWVGSLTTDASGRATTTVTLPDSLTTYRIMAVAGDVSSQFGAGDSEIQTTQPLTLLPAFPRFLSVGNRASFGAVVTNNSPAGGDATVTIRNMEASALTFEGETTHSVRLAPGESAPVRFDARALAPGAARVRVTVRLGENTDAFEVPLRVLSPARLETVAAYGDTVSQASERLALPTGIVPTAGGLTISLASTALVGLGESARYLDDYPYQCAEPLASKALALLLSSDLDGAFGVAGADAAAQRAQGLQALADLATFQCPRDGGFSMFRTRCVSSPYLTAYVLHILHIAGTLQAPTDQNAINSALNYLRGELRKPAPEAQWWPGWAATQAYTLKVLTEYGRRQTEQLDQLYALRERLPVFALSYLADALVASGDRGPRYADVIRRMTNALRVDADRAHVEEVDDPSLVWLWNSNVRATAVVLEGLARRRDSGLLAAPMARWLLAERRNGRWQTTQDNGVALNALVSYYRTFEADVRHMTVTTTLGNQVVGTTPLEGRSTVAHDIEVAMADVLSQPTADVTIDRVGTGRVYYTTRLQYLPTAPPPPVDRGLRFTRTYERVLADGSSEATTTFNNGDLVRVTVEVALPHEGRFLAVTDPVAAGLEPIDGALKTTASDLGAQATRQSSNSTLYGWWRQGGFDHIEKHDDRVVAFATRLGAGRHTISYLARATTSGTFETQGTWGEALYAPEITGRTAPTTVIVR